MQDQPRYHAAPHTLDPQREIPDDAPLASGNDEAEAERVRVADEQLTEAVEQEAERERQAETERAERPTPKPSEFAQGTTTEDQQGSVPEGTVQELLDWVGEDSGRAQQAYDAEQQRSSPRSSLLGELEAKGAV